jgi:pimeloyl-ACP methyl ester carboxylesterase
MADIVLVPGAWLGAWAWEAVTGPLRGHGHAVYPVTLTGVAERAAQAGPEVNLDTHVDDLARLLAERELREAVLVAHSYGGFPVTAVAQRLPDRIARVIYVDSGAMPDGATQLGMMEPAEQSRLRATVGDDGLLPPPAWDPHREPLLDGLDEAALALLRKRSTAHPFGSWTQPIRRTGRLSVPLALISCSFPLDQVRAMIGTGHPFFAELADAELRELPTGHWPMFSEPRRLADLLAALATARG